MAEHLSTDGSEAPKTETDKRIMQRMVKTMGVGGTIVFVGVVILVIGRKLLHSEMADLAGGLILLAGAFIMTYAIFSAMWRSVSTPGHKGESGDLAKPESHKRTSPEGLAAPPPSVTEQTTKILETNLAENGRKEPRA